MQSNISFAIPVHNEHNELDRLLTQLLLFIRDSDEIVIQKDSTVTPEVEDVIFKYSNDPKIKVIQFPLNGNYAEFKNNLKNNCRGDYIFQIDADEELGSFLLYAHEIIEQSPDIELFYISRINTVEGITEEYLSKMGWKIASDTYNGNNIINWPDAQARLFKNIKRIKWKNKVHEQLTGFKTYTLISDGTTNIESNRKFSLIHEKTFDRQIKQNEFYKNLAK